MYRRILLSMSRIAVTAASSRFGAIVLGQLLEKFPAGQLVAVARDVAKLAPFAAKGVCVSQASYDDPEALERSLAGAEKLLLIASKEFGQVARQHATAIAAAKRAGVGLIVYTSVLRADSTPLTLGREHAETEAVLRASGIPHIILRNGWFHEAYMPSLKPSLAHGAMVGCAGAGRISSAARSDYATAAVIALTGGAELGRTYELAGDYSYTLPELARELAWQVGKPVPYIEIPEADYVSLLVDARLPRAFAELIASWDVAASKGALFDEGRALGTLLGRPTVPISDAVRAELADMKSLPNVKLSPKGGLLS